jgi:hypothetical protein
VERLETITALKSGIEALRTEEKRLLGLSAVVSPDTDLEHRLLAVSDILSVLKEKLSDLEHKQ